MIVPCIFLGAQSPPHYQLPLPPNAPLDQSTMGSANSTPSIDQRDGESSSPSSNNPENPSALSANPPEGMMGAASQGPTNTPQATSTPRYFVEGSSGNNSNMRPQSRFSRRSGSHSPSSHDTPSSSNRSNLFNLVSSSEQHRERARREDRQLREEFDDDRARREGNSSNTNANFMDIDEGTPTPTSSPMEIDGATNGEGSTTQVRRGFRLRHRFRPRSQSAGNPLAAESPAPPSESPHQARGARELFGSLTQAPSTESHNGENESNRSNRHRMMERMLATIFAGPWSTFSNGSAGRSLFGRNHNNRSDDQSQNLPTSDARRSATPHGFEEGLEEIISILQNAPRSGGESAANSDGTENSQSPEESSRPPSLQPTPDGRGFIINAGDGSTMRMFRLPSNAPPTNNNDGRPRLVPVFFIAIRTVTPPREAQPSDSTTNAQVSGSERPEEAIETSAEIQEGPLAQGQASAARDQSNADQNSQDARNRRTISWIVYIVGGNVPPGHPMASWGLPPNPGPGDSNSSTSPNSSRSNAPTAANALQALFSENPSYEDLLLLSMLMGPARPPTTTQGEIDSALPVQLWNEEVRNILLGDADKCRVCLSDYEEGEEVRVLGCRHGFHRECIDKWLTEGSNKCPMCRSTPVGSGSQQDRPVVSFTP